jgi:hypothetical protein
MTVSTDHSLNPAVAGATTEGVAQMRHRGPLDGGLFACPTSAFNQALRITLNIDGAPLESRSRTHPSHSETSRLLTSSLSLGVPVPLAGALGTQCM